MVVIYCGNRVQADDISSPLRKGQLHSPQNVAATGTLISKVIHNYEFICNLFVFVCSLIAIFKSRYISMSTV